jgi:hypothetical protein
MGLQHRFLRLLVAMVTKPMRCFGSLTLWLQHTSECTEVEVFQLVILLLAAPCFKASHFFFKLAYLINERRALLLNRESCLVRGDNLGCNSIVFASMAAVPRRSIIACVRSTADLSEASNPAITPTSAIRDLPHACADRAH